MKPRTCEMQRQLRYIGNRYYKGPPDGIFGAATKRAVAAFRADNGMKPRGVWNRAAAEAAEVQTKRIQRLLNGHGADIAVSGLCTDETVAAIKVFQRRKGIKPDGVAAGETLACLCEIPAHIAHKDEYLSAHFMKSEFMCSCGGRHCGKYPSGIDVRLIVALEALRSAVNRRFPLGCGYERAVTIREGLRCAVLNAERDGAENEPLTTGRAAVISAGGLTGAKVRRVCADIGVCAQKSEGGYTKIIIAGGENE